MPNYKQLYFKLFAAMADAVEHMENENYELARQALATAQRQAEEAYISAEREEENASCIDPAPL